MRKYKQVPAIVLLLIGFGLSMIEAVPRSLILAILIAAAVLLCFSSRSSYYFSKASKIIRAKDVSRFPEAVGYLDKAINAGMPDNYLVIAASILMQYGDQEKAKNALIPVTSSKKKDIAGLAKITLSMYYFANGDLDEAIRLCESAKEDDGSTDRNLYVNLGVYYLRQGDRKNFRKNVKEAVSRYPSSPAVIDSQSIVHMLDGRWDLAGATLFAIFDTVTPSFADPYVHMAFVHMHYGEIEKARQELEKAGSTLFTNISVYQPDEIEKMRKALETGDEILPFINAVESDICASSSGLMPEWGKGEPTEERTLLPGFPAEPDFKKEVLPEKDIVDDEDDDINTDLTDEDERWLEKHQD